jgi:hypothetical protein
MIDFIETIAIASVGAALLAVVCSVPHKRAWTVVVGAVLGAWAGLAIAVAASGKLAEAPILGMLVALPLVVTAALVLAFPAVRAALLSIPTPLIIALNAFRIIGLEFLVLASVGRVSGPFPFSAGCGDVLVALLAIPVAILATRTRASDPRIITWNVLGTLDFVSAYALAIVSANGSPLQLIHAGAGSGAAVQFLPWSLIPTVLAPLFLIGHGIVFAQARAASAIPRAHLRGSPATHA